MSLAIYFTSYVLNMFRTLIHPSSGACDFSIVSPHWSSVFLFRCVLEFRYGWVGVVSVWQANMFRTLIRPSSGACDFSIVSPHWSCVLVSMWLGRGGIRVAGFSTHRTKNNTTNVVIQQNSCKLLMMYILMSETC